jgi:heme/copper-type cytochrome/quinol oxidase subunit 2
MIVAFAGSAASEGFYEDISWRWGFACFAIILPVVASPLFFLLKYNLRKAHAQGLVRQERSERTFVQSVWHYVVEFDGTTIPLCS